MTKLRKTMMMFVFILAVVLGTTAGTSNAKAATTKNFKGNLNVTYKNSEWKSKITVKKVNSKKVSVKVVVYDIPYGPFYGKVISKDTIQIKLDGGEKLKLKWKDKTHFTSKRPSSGFTNESIQYVHALCSALNNTKYTQVKKSSTVYYSSYAGNGYTNASIKLKGNKLVVKGYLKKGTKKSVGEVKGNTSVLKNATKTFKLDKNFRAYSYDGYLEKYYKIPKSDIGKGYRGGKNGLTFVLTIKNGKVTRIDFYS